MSYEILNSFISFQYVKDRFDLHFIKKDTLPFRFFRFLKCEAWDF
jgi:hypothetical protein